MSEVSVLRNVIESSLGDRFPGIEFVFDGGQRLVFFVPGEPDSALKIWSARLCGVGSASCRGLSNLSGQMMHGKTPRGRSDRTSFCVRSRDA